MWLAVDTNQASRLPEPAQLSGTIPQLRGVSLSPLVLAEVLLFHKAAPREQIAKFNIRIGLEVPDVIERLAALDAVSVRDFEPFAVGGNPEDDDYFDLLESLRSPSAMH